MRKEIEMKISKNVILLILTAWTLMFFDVFAGGGSGVVIDNFGYLTENLQNEYEATADMEEGEFLDYPYVFDDIDIRENQENEENVQDEKEGPLDNHFYEYDDVS